MTHTTPEEGSPNAVPSRFPVANLVSVGAAAAALTAHRDALGIEGDEQTQLWHLVASLHEFAAGQGLSLVDVVGDVRKHIKLGGLSLPASSRAMTLESRSA